MVSKSRSEHEHDFYLQELRKHELKLAEFISSDNPYWISEEFHQTLYMVDMFAKATRDAAWTMTSDEMFMSGYKHNSETKSFESGGAGR